MTTTDKDELKLQGKFAFHILVFSLSVPTVILTVFKLQQIRRELEWAVRVDFGVDRILRAHRGDFILMALGALLVLAGLASLVRIIVLARRAKREQGSPVADRTRERAVSSAAERAVVSPRHGQDRYLRQLDEYLKNGIIDKAEYKVLKERHARR
jgi:C4-dicarboxylate-specific signal transduction histidine kinase